jgi:hypothetical protein
MRRHPEVLVRSEPRFTASVCVLLAVAALLSLTPLPTAAQGPARQPSATIGAPATVVEVSDLEAPAGEVPDEFSAGEWGEMTDAIAEDQRRSALHLRPVANAAVGGESPVAGRFDATHPVHGVRSRIAPDWADFRTDCGEAGFRLSLVGWGDGAAAITVEPASEAVHDGARVEYVRGPVSEWYEHGEAGMMQGFTIAQPPAPGHDGDLAVRLALDTNLTPTISADARSLHLRDSDGTVTLRYAGLVAWDATGRDLPAAMKLESMDLVLVVDAHGAHYPVTIDPTISATQTVQGTDTTSPDNFGISVAVDGDTAVIGARWDKHSGLQEAGSAYVFTRSGTTWSQQAKLTAGTDAAVTVQFGHSVAIDGDTVVIGAIYDDQPGEDNCGAAYVFTRSGTTWSQQARLVAGDATADDWFGNSVAIDGDTAVIGAYADDPAGTPNAGAAYVFTRSGTSWSEQAKLIAGDPGYSADFGLSVAVSGDTAVIGTPENNNVGGTNAGAAYVFTRVGTSWSEQAKLLAGDAADDDRFGWSVAVFGDTAVIGARNDDHAGGGDAGSAYVFTRSGTSWSQQAKLTAGDAAGNDFFGWSVAVDGDIAVIGATGNDAGAPQAGSAYLFRRSGTKWSEQAKYLGPPNSDARLGRSVSVSGETALAGAHEDTGGGSASFFPVPAAPVGTTTTSSSGCAIPASSQPPIGLALLTVLAIVTLTALRRRAR